jgi:hypothetical protein
MEMRFLYAYTPERRMTMEDVLTAIWIVLLSMLMFKDMSGKDELRRIREQLEKMNERENK